jgi:cell filamentation protein
MSVLADEVAVNQVFTAADLCAWHRRWLGNVYPWAGRYRTLNLSKDDFPFAASAQIPRLMGLLERDVLANNTPCQGMPEDRLAEAIATVHVELILIHPFREGNGRIARVLASLMALQAGWPNLDFVGIGTGTSISRRSVRASPIRSG